MHDDQPVPTTPATLGVPRAEPQWPKVLGIIMLVFGLLGLLGSAIGLLFSLFMLDWMASIMPAEFPSSLPAMLEYKTWMSIVALLDLGFAALLTWAGLALVRQRANAPKLCMTWAVLRALHVVQKAALQWPVTIASFDAMSRPPENGAAAMPQFPEGIIVAMAALAVGVTLVWGWALPGFLIIWFRRRKVRETTATWHDDR